MWWWCVVVAFVAFVLPLWRGALGAIVGFRLSRFYYRRLMVKLISRGLNITISAKRLRG